MNRPVCCCSETCPVHCLVPSPRVPPSTRPERARVREAAGGGVGEGLWPDHLRHSSCGLLAQRGVPSPACEVRPHLGDSGGGGEDIGVLGWGPRSPPVLHILIHSIFGTRKGTNISVLNSFPSSPLSPPLVPLRLPSLPSLAPHCHCHPTWGRDAPAGLGLARVLLACPGDPAGPPPLAEL